MMPDDILKQVNEHEFRSLIAYLQTPAQVPMLATADNAKEFFNGKDLTGWDGDKELWKVENGEIVGKTATGLKKNNFLEVAHWRCENFKLSLKVKLTPNKENSGIQFRSVPLPDGEMRGPQADIGAGLVGQALRGERPRPAREGGRREVRQARRVERLRRRGRGRPREDLDQRQPLHRLRRTRSSPAAASIGFQIHSGGPMEVRFKDIKLEVLK